MTTRYITTAIPFVNGNPHLGFAMEIVQTDIIARHWRHRGDKVRFLTGTDDNSLKNVIAAENEGKSTQDLVDQNALSFYSLRDSLQASFDDFIRTSTDPRHHIGVEKLWRAAFENGDLYEKEFEGLYCVGCEQFYSDDELENGLCPEHLVAPNLISETNWFFRLSRYQDQIQKIIDSGTVSIEPSSRKNEISGFIKTGLQDFSVSRSVARARGWGIPVPNDESQVIYVWWDALGNYINALNYGTDGEEFREWWTNSDTRVHVIGKGILRFHAVYWIGMLLSAGLELPTKILVHDYLTVDGKKLGKSLGNSVDPTKIVDEFGIDALRWWLIREVPRVGEADYTVDRLIARYNEDLANGIGNLISRTVTMVHKYRDGYVDVSADLEVDGPLAESMSQVKTEVDNSIEAYDFRRAAEAIWRIVDEANKYVVDKAPWKLAKQETLGTPSARKDLDTALSTLCRAIMIVADELEPFLPNASVEIKKTMNIKEGRIPSPNPLFKRIARSDIEP